MVTLTSINFYHNPSTRVNYAPKLNLIHVIEDIKSVTVAADLRSRVDFLRLGEASEIQL